MVVENKPVAIGENGPVIAFHFVVAPETAMYSAVITQLEITKISSRKLIQLINGLDLPHHRTPVHLIDINFDGYKDLFVESSSGASNSTYAIALFEPTTGIFDDDWIRLMNPTIDAENQQIIELSCGGCACGNYTRTFYKVYDGAMRLVKQEHQEVCGVDDEKFYSLSERIDGDMVETIRKDMSDEY